MDWPLLASLPPEDRERLLARTRPRTYVAGDILVLQGDPSDSLHLVESGRLAVRVETAEGDTAMLNVIGAGSWFGELSLLGTEAPVRTATVVALEASTTRSLTTSAFFDLRQRFPAVDKLLLTLLARRVDELSSRLVEVMYDGLELRVHRRLADLARTYGNALDQPVTVPFTQEQLAGLVGGTRSSVNEVLQQLARDEVVGLGRGRIVVLDREELELRARR